MVRKELNFTNITLIIQYYSIVNSFIFQKQFIFMILLSYLKLSLDIFLFFRIPLNIAIKIEDIAKEKREYWVVNIFLKKFLSIHHAIIIHIFDR